MGHFLAQLYCINLYQLCPKKEGYHRVSFLFYYSQSHNPANPCGLYRAMGSVIYRFSQNPFFR